MRDKILNNYEGCECRVDFVDKLLTVSGEWKSTHWFTYHDGDWFEYDGPKPSLVSMVCYDSVIDGMGVIERAVCEPVPPIEPNNPWERQVGGDEMRDKILNNYEGCECRVDFVDKLLTVSGEWFEYDGLKPSLVSMNCYDSIADGMAAIERGDEPNNPWGRQVGGDHYKSQGLQPGQFVERNGYSYFVSETIVKLCRYDKKHGDDVEAMLTDLDKCIHNIEILKYELLHK